MTKGLVLIIGGAGFIGSHTADELFRRGYKIRILDNLSPKTHFGRWPGYLNPKFEKIKGDARDRKILEKSLKGVDFVIHLAAVMDLMPDYSLFFDTNVTSTALLYEIIVAKKLPVKKVVVASSQFVYGEGRWECKKDGEVFPKQRINENLIQKKWDPVCPKCGKKISSLQNLETHQDPPNQYAISKYTQELIALKLGRLNGIPSSAMRYSIVHGPRQSLKNAYSGALRIFTLQLLVGKEASIYEDGLSKRDYVSVYDVARANADVLENPKADYENFNVGSGKSYTVIELCNMVAKAIAVIRHSGERSDSRIKSNVRFWMNKVRADALSQNDVLKYEKEIKFKPTGEFRVGDIRHAVSSIAKLEKLGWRVKDSEEKIVKEYVSWVKEQKLDRDYLSLAEGQMKKMGVLKKVK